jgi:hypothetical protein
MALAKKAEQALHGGQAGIRRMVEELSGSRRQVTEVL